MDRRTLTILLGAFFLFADGVERAVAQTPEAGTTSKRSDFGPSERANEPPSVKDLIGGDALLGDDGESRRDPLKGDDLLAKEPLGSDDPLLMEAFRLAPSTAAEGDSLLDDGLLPGTGDDPLLDPLLGGSGLGEPSADSDPATAAAADRDPHEALWTENCYPSAETCRQCHPRQYEEWRASGHAYSAISPMFNRFEQAMVDLTQGTVGSFCVRCHSPVGTQLNVPRASSILDAPPVVREGVTCIACHRIREHYWRSNGDRRIEPGDIHEPVSGGHGGQGVARAIAEAEKWKLKVSPEDSGPGQAIHRTGMFFKPLTNSDICVSCHQVAVHPGIWLEVVHAQYRSGPAAKKGITCQDCHMGAVPGKALGYEFAHAAELSGKPFGEPRKHSNHTFWGPGYSIAHPGLFPHHPDLKRYSPRQWVTFDYRAGWGTESFEANVPEDATFPPPWDHVDDRIDARRIIDANLEKIQQKRASAVMTMEAAIKVSDPMFLSEPRRGDPLTIAFRVSNRSDGHNAPTGSLGAQPQLWLNAVLIDPTGKRVWESGYLDANADLADMHSVEVAEGRIRRDKDLFNLQTKFLINNIRGTDREVPVPLNFSLDQLVFLRPGAVPVSVLNHPPLIRMEAHSIPPLDSRMAKYHIPASAMRHSGPYRLSVRMRSRTEPMYFMRLVGSTPDMIRRMNENMIDFQCRSHTFWVD